MLTFTGALKCTDLHELQVACGCGPGCGCDRDVILDAQAALKTQRAFFEDARDYLFRPLIQSSSKPSIDLYFLDEEIHALELPPVGSCN